MDYKEKYEQALERAKIWQEHLYEVGDKDYADELNYIFPELKESEDEKIRKALIDFHQNSLTIKGINAKKIIAWLEKQGKQNIADKAESKFHEGDWVVRKKDGCCFCSGCNTVQIRNIDKDKAVWFETDTWLFEDEIRHWTIEDAKDGDVLACNNVIYLTHGNTKSLEQFHAYFGVSLNGTPSTFINEWCCLAYKDEVLPATKEQRDILFQKMKEAGYEWDNEKKELNKIVNC